MSTEKSLGIGCLPLPQYLEHQILQEKLYSEDSHYWKSFREERSLLRMSFTRYHDDKDYDWPRVRSLCYAISTARRHRGTLAIRKPSHAIKKVIKNESPAQTVMKRTQNGSIFAQFIEIKKRSEHVLGVFNI